METLVEAPGKRIHISVLDNKGEWLTLLEMNVSPDINKFYRLPIMIKVVSKDKSHDSRLFNAS